MELRRLRNEGTNWDVLFEWSGEAYRAQVLESLIFLSQCSLYFNIPALVTLFNKTNQQKNFHILLIVLKKNICECYSNDALSVNI